ncbi:hypothetical protein Ocin01_05256 [Orchesella cincta]|uniref:CUB domain-containing protein n=1 Tax=Orchesella cincta TaxID=48709 RepID=A0A1D2N831_ORCCI|nr:hypothetical protein Ocin01_05256 [Orchesella cincta]
MGKLLSFQFVVVILFLTEMASSMSRFNMEPEDLALQQSILYPEGSSYEVRSQSQAQLEEQSIEESQSQTTPRKSKFFPYFLIQFPNEPCTAAGGSGVCVSAKDCKAGGGTSVGVCAQGFGACCRFSKSCGSEKGGDVIVRENSADLKSSEGSCRFVLPKTRGICQVKLDFTEFEFGTGLPTGECSATKISISGGINLPQGSLDLCGSLKSQHLYLTYGSTEKIYITSSAAGMDTDKYSIRVSYIRCDSRQLAPSHCTQYYTSSQGEIRSINFPQQQLNNQDYTICIADPRDAASRSGRQITNPKGISWETCGTEPNNFLISGKATDPPVTNPTLCTTDYIQIFGVNRQCGNSFSATQVLSTPYLLRVKFDDAESKAPEAELIVSNPGKCTDLNTSDTICTDGDVAGTCKCVKLVGQPGLDETNTGFCLKYKITE